METITAIYSDLPWYAKVLVLQGCAANIYMALWACRIAALLPRGVWVGARRWLRASRAEREIAEASQTQQLEAIDIAEAAETHRLRLMSEEAAARCLAATECSVVRAGELRVLIPAECGVRDLESQDGNMRVEIALAPGDSIKISRAGDEEPIKAPVDQPLAKLAVGDRTSHPAIWKMGVGRTAAAAAAGYKASRESKPLEVPATVMLPPAPDGWEWIVDSWFRYDNYVGPVYEGCPEANECHVAGWFNLVRK